MKAQIYENKQLKFENVPSLYRMWTFVSSTKYRKFLFFCIQEQKFFLIHGERRAQGPPLRLFIVAKYLFHEILCIDHIFLPSCHPEITEMGSKDDGAGRRHCQQFQGIMP